MKTNDRPLTDLMNAVDTGAAQLPDFQRGWVWDDGRIRALILSVIHNFPVGAAMFLEYGNESIHFKHKPIEGSGANPNTEPDELILDGQQRLTSLYNALYSKNPVHTKTDKGKEIDRYYYLDIEKALDPSADDEEVVVSIPASRQVTSDFGRKIEKKEKKQKTLGNLWKSCTEATLEVMIRYSGAIRSTSERMNTGIQITGRSSVSMSTSSMG